MNRRNRLPAYRGEGRTAQPSGRGTAAPNLAADAAFPSPQGGGWPLPRRGEGLVEVGEDVVDVLEADGEGNVTCHEDAGGESAL